MAFTRTVIVAALVVAVPAQLCLAGCILGSGSSYGSGIGGNRGDSHSSGISVVSGGSYGLSSKYDSSSYGSGSSSCGSSGPRESWTNIPSDAIVSHTPVSQSCGFREIYIPDEPTPAVGIVRSQPVCAQHLSYEIEVPVEQAQSKPSYHSVNVEVPIKQRNRNVFTHLPYHVEVPVEQNEQCKLAPLDVQVAVPVRQRIQDTRLHGTYTVEVPEQTVSSRLLNLRSHVDRVVLPQQEYCLPPNNGPAALEEVRYVAVPAPGPQCLSPVGLLGLSKNVAASSGSTYVSGSTYGSGSGSGYVSDSDSTYGSDSGSASGTATRSGSRGCSCPCDD